MKPIEIIAAFIGLLILGIVFMGIFNLCPPKGPWPKPPWCIKEMGKQVQPSQEQVPSAEKVEKHEKPSLPEKTAPEAKEKSKEESTSKIEEAKEVESKQKEAEEEETIEITFSAEAPQASELEIFFPVFWYEFRMPPLKMEKRGIYFEKKVKLPKNALIRYGYRIPNTPWEKREQYKPEYEPHRMILTDGSVTSVKDKIYSFGPETVSRPLLLSGRVLDKQTKEPILDAIIVVDGIIALSVGDGSYSLNVRPGKHILIAYMLDGSYKTHMQQIEIDSNKKLDIYLEKANPARVTINVSANIPDYFEIRMFSTAEQTGIKLLYHNRFITEAFKPVQDGKIILDLYEGQYVDYIYSIGNTAIGYEKGDHGNYIIRHFIAKDGLVIDDNVGRFWDDKAITLNVKVPSYTDPNDIIGVKGLHPLLLYLHRKEDNIWTIMLEPYNFQGREYRYYRNVVGMGDEETLSRKADSKSKIINDTVSAWKLQKGPITHASFSIPPIKNKFSIFAFPPDYYNGQFAMLMEPTIKRIAQKGFHGVVLSQIWNYEAVEPFAKISRAEPISIYTPAFEIKRLTKIAHENGLKVALFPQLVGSPTPGNPKTFGPEWWNKWFDEIEKFNLYNARTARDANVDFLLFKDREPGMNLPSNFKATFNKRMKEIIAKIKKIYKGKIIARVDIQNFDRFDYWEDADIISQKTWSSLGVTNPTLDRLVSAVGNLLDTKYKKAYERAKKPFLIDQLAYYSVKGAANGQMVPEAEDESTDKNLKYPLDVEVQKLIHEAFYRAINERDWIIGVYLFGYSFVDLPEGRGVTIRGKPAEDVGSGWAKKIREVSS